MRIAIFFGLLLLTLVSSQAMAGTSGPAQMTPATAEVPAQAPSADIAPLRAVYHHYHKYRCPSCGHCRWWCCVHREWGYHCCGHSHHHHHW